MASTKNQTQMKKVVATMIRRKDKEWFMAGDFQEPNIRLGDELFVGWEATARMSDLSRMFPAIVESKRQGKFRYLRFRLDNTMAMFSEIPADWVSFIKEELAQAGRIYKIKKVVYEPSGENSVRPVEKEIEVLPTQNNLL